MVLREGQGYTSEEGVTPLLQTLSAQSSIVHVCTAHVLQPLGEHLHIFLQQQELTKNHVGL